MQIKFCAILVLCYFFTLNCQKWKKSYFWVKITFLEPKIKIIFNIWPSFLLIVVLNIVKWGFWTFYSLLKTTKIWLSLAKDQKWPKTTLEYHFHMVCSHFLGKFRAQYNEYWIFCRLAFTFFRVRSSILMSK